MFLKKLEKNVPFVWNMTILHSTTGRQCGRWDIFANNRRTIFQFNVLSALYSGRIFCFVHFARVRSKTNLWRLSDDFYNKPLCIGTALSFPCITRAHMQTKWIFYFIWANTKTSFLMCSQNVFKHHTNSSFATHFWKKTNYAKSVTMHRSKQ